MTVDDESREGTGAWARLAERVRLHHAGARASVHRLPGGHHVWRVGTALVGGIVVLAGIIMLVLPGPGWLVIFLGLGIWATEFAWASSLLRFVRRHVARWTAWAGRQPRWMWVGAGTACLAVVVAGAALVLF